MLIVLLGVLGACSQVTTDRDTITEQKECTGADVPGQNLPEASAWTWLNVTIGESTEQDIIAEFGEPDLTRLRPDGRPEACLYIFKEDDGNSFNVWIAGDTVIGLEFGQTYPRQPTFQRAEIPRTFEQAKELYGRAELVGYSNGGFARTIVWPTKGIQAEVSIVSESLAIGAIRYFTPMTEEEFYNSLWSNYILEENPTLYPTSDLRDTAPKDPFDWD